MPTAIVARIPRAPSPADVADRLIASSDDRRGWKFLSDRIPGFPYQEGMWTICREVDGLIVGAWGYTDFTPVSCQIHFAGATPRWLTQDLLWKAFHVPFEQWGLRTLIGVISGGNEPSLNVAKKLGFKIFATLPDAHPDGALVFHVMRRDECKWLAMPRRLYGQGWR